METHSGISSRGRHELATVLSSGRRFVTPGVVVEALHLTPEIAAKKLSRWAAQGWLRRARRGLYIPVPVDAASPGSWSEDSLIVAAAVWPSSYFTGWTAASHWNLTEQVFRTTVLKAADRVRTSSVHLLDHEYLVKHVSAAALEWGLTTEWKAEVRLRFADKPRTIVDILDTPRLGGGIRHSAEILASFLDDNDPAPLVQYGDRLGNRAVFKRLGYLTQALNRNPPGLLDACLARVSAGISPLDPSGPKGGPVSSKWRLRVNVRVQPEEPA